VKSEREEVMQQVRQAQEETSATMVANGNFVYEPQGKSERGAGIGQWIRTRIGRRVRALFYLVAALALGWGLWTGYAQQTKLTASVFVTGVKQMAALATAEAYVMTTIEGQDNKIFGQDIGFDLPGTKRTFMLVIPAKILAGVNLEGLSEEDVAIDHTRKTVTLTLPHATFISEAVQNDKVRVFSNEGLFRGPITAKEGFDMISQAKVTEQLHTEAENSGVLKMAETNAEKALQALYSKFGYDVKVVYR
jgi:hypothetical protein